VNERAAIWFACALISASVGLVWASEHQRWPAIVHVVTATLQCARGVWLLR
jgi:hypothetical protein